MSVHPPARFSRAGYSTDHARDGGGPPSRVSFSFTAAPETSGLFAFARWFARALASAPKIGWASGGRDCALAEAPPRRRLRAVAAEPAGARQRERDATGGDERLRVRGVFFFVRVIVVILGSGVPRPAPARAGRAASSPPAPSLPRRRACRATSSLSCESSPRAVITRGAIVLRTFARRRLLRGGVPREKRRHRPRGDFVFATASRRSSAAAWSARTRSPPRWHAEPRVYRSPRRRRRGRRRRASSGRRRDDFRRRPPGWFLDRAPRLERGGDGVGGGGSHGEHARVGRRSRLPVRPHRRPRARVQAQPRGLGDGNAA